MKTESFLSICRRCWEFIFRVIETIGDIVLGDLLEALRRSTRIHDTVSVRLRQHNGTFTFRGPWFTGLNFVITSDADNVNHILNKSFTNYAKGEGFREIFEVLGDGIFNVDGDCWKLQKRMIHSFLTNSEFVLARNRVTREKILDGVFDILEMAADSGSEVDAQELFRRFMFDTSCMLMLDQDPKCLTVNMPKVAHEEAFSRLEKVILTRHIYPPWVWKLCRWLDIGGEKMARRARATLDRFLHECISRKRVKMMREGRNGKEVDMLSYFMSLEKEGEESEEVRALISSEKFLRDTALNLMAAGRDAVSAGLSWLLYLLTTHPDIEEKILEEMKEISGDLGKKEKIFKEEEISKLVYLNAAILETLRLYPPVPFEHKSSTEEDTLPSGHKIRKNGKVIYSLYAMGRMKSIWGEDCLEFKPERWISEKGKIKHVPCYKFIAFNAGPRTCMGKQLALFQIKTLSSSMIWNYRFELVQDNPIYPSCSIILDMNHGLRVKVFKRESPGNLSKV